MKYLATLGGGTGGIEHEILQTNSILEAFGNAKTSRNSNSSRFVSCYDSFFSLSFFFFVISLDKLVLDVHHFYTFLCTFPFGTGEAD